MIEFRLPFIYDIQPLQIKITFYDENIIIFEIII
jgi:hypothetical protein